MQLRQRSLRLNWFKLSLILKVDYPKHFLCVYLKHYQLSLVSSKDVLILILQSLPPTQMQKLTFCLLYEIGKGTSSWWFPYLKHLPQSYDILATFGDFEKQALQVQFSVCGFFIYFLGLYSYSWTIFNEDFLHVFLTFVF